MGKGTIFEFKKKSFLNKILNEFKENNFYYSLTPVSQGNDYENFFLKRKQVIVNIMLVHLLFSHVLQGYLHG